MDLKEKCEEVMRMKGWKNEDLAAALDMTAPNLSSAKAGRRPMPYKALIKLEKLRGVDDHSIIEQLLKTAACVALAIVFLLVPARENVAYASDAYTVAIDNNTNYRCFRYRYWQACEAPLASTELHCPPSNWVRQ